MGWIRDLLKEVPLSTVLQERVELAEEKFAKVEAEAQSLRDRIVALESENAELRGRLPRQGTVSADGGRILVCLFREEGRGDKRHLAGHLQMEVGVVQYHLDRLKELGFAQRTGGRADGTVFWGVTAEGRRYVVEKGLLG